MPDELSPSQAATRIGATTRSVQRWIAAGRLPARRVGGRWRVAIDALDAFSAPRTGAFATARAASITAGAAATTIPRRRITSVFVANRGEIARRIARTCDRLGLTAIIPDTDSSDGLDLLDDVAVVSAARAAEADALHPGFGFLAENADFAVLVESAGIAWIGPPPEAIRAMGDKAAARRLAGRLGVAVVPGYDGDDQTDSRLAREADRVGYPVLIKPAGGGGGKGMRVVRDRAAFAESLVSARREAGSAFGDDRVILERLLEGPRHIEIQVLFDSAGNGVHLGERNCSIQRRHQKILEETPSPGIDDGLRDQLADAALRLAAAVGYVSAGTCEFLVDDRGRFYFLEMNTRLQVEHPVTELVTGRDLVADQIRIAGGEALGFTQADVRFRGYAIEVRLYAEDPEAGFLPATGRVEALHWPAGHGVRVDSGIGVGSEITGRFDPMLAKVAAHARTRAEALEELAHALDETLLLGVVTNLRFLRWLVRQPAVVEGQARIDTLDRIWPPDDWAERSAIPDDAWSGAAALLVEEAANPWAGGWRLNGPATVRVRSGDEIRTVEVSDAMVWRAVKAGTTVHADIDGRSVPFELAPPPDVDRAARAAAAHGATAAAEVVAPMPGAVLTVHIRDGNPVEAGAPIVTLEAMKMEHLVTAPSTGRIADVAIAPGDQVTRGQVLAVVEPIA